MQTLHRWKVVLRRTLRRTKKATRLILKSISGRIKHVWQVCILFFVIYRGLLLYQAKDQVHTMLVLKCSLHLVINGSVNF